MALEVSRIHCKMVLQIGCDRVQTQLPAPGRRQAHEAHNALVQLPFATYCETFGPQYRTNNHNFPSSNMMSALDVDWDPRLPDLTHADLTRKCGRGCPQPLVHLQVHNQDM
jgi:hypothetical protein